MTAASLAYDEAVHIPAGVSDLHRFRQWVHSDEFPEHWKVTFVKGEIIVLLYDEAVHIPAGVNDLNSFRRWAHSDDFPERGRITFVKGEIIVDVAPLEIDTHIFVCRDVGCGIGNYCDRTNIGEILFHPLLVSDDAHLATEPDLVFCRWTSLRAKSVWYREWEPGSGELVEVAGSPDMVMEIVSRGSIRKDTRTLRTAYFEAGVLEYWLIDARGREIDFQLLTRGESEYVAAEPDAAGFRFSPVFGTSFRLTRGINPVGGARYHLELRPPNG